MEHAEVTNSLNNMFEVVVEGVKTIGCIVVGLVFVVAHPILGPLGAIACLFSAAYHGILLHYHWRHTGETDQNGELISGTEFNQLNQFNPKNYTNKNAQFSTPEDLARLQHEVDRLYHVQAFQKSLEWLPYLAFCIAPILGLVLITSPFISYIEDSQKKICLTPEQQCLENRINRLTEELKTKNSMKEVLSNPEGAIFETLPTDLHPGIEIYRKAYYEVKQRSSIQIFTK